jgi:uncharacterized protein with GYD domain
MGEGGPPQERSGRMPKYLIKASYSPEGMKGVMARGGAARETAIDKLVSGVGGSVEWFYFAFGGDDDYTPPGS